MGDHFSPALFEALTSNDTKSDLRMTETRFPNLQIFLEKAKEFFGLRALGTSDH